MNAYKFSYSCRCTQSGDMLKKFGFFTSMDVFKKMLKKWTNDHWEYLQTASQQDKNERQKQWRYEIGEILDLSLSIDSPNKGYILHGSDRDGHALTVMKPVKPTSNLVKRRIKVEAWVIAEIVCDRDEDITERCLDIYLHGQGDTGHFNKIDLGSDSDKITVLETEEL